MLFAHIAQQFGYLLHYGEHETLAMFAVADLIAIEMDSFYTGEGFGYILALPFIAANGYMMPQELQMADERYTPGGVPQPPV